MNNRAQLIAHTTEFIRALKTTYDGREGRRDLASVEKIFHAFKEIALPPKDTHGNITRNTIGTILSPGKQPPKSTRRVWNTLIDCICSFDVEGNPGLTDIQESIQTLLEEPEIDPDQYLATIFNCGEPAGFDQKLVGEYCIYRQITNDSQTRKALLTIAAMPVRSGLKFMFIHTVGEHRGRHARGRVFKLSSHWLLIGSLYNQHGYKSNGAFVMALAHTKDESRNQINKNQLTFCPSFVTLFSDYDGTPHGTKAVLIRAESEGLLSKYDAFKSLENLEHKLEYFERTEEVLKLPFEDAIAEIHVRSDITENSIEEALTNVIEESENTLHFTTSIN